MAVGSGSNTPWAEGPANYYLDCCSCCDGQGLCGPYFLCVLSMLACFPSTLCVSLLPSAFPCCQRQGLYGPGDLHVLSLSACFPTTLCVSTLTLSFSMLLGARPMWTRCSSCTFIVRMLSYHSLLLLSVSMLLGARPVWTRCSSRTFIIRLLSCLCVSLLLL